MNLKEIALIEGINDYFNKRTKSPMWMDKEEKKEWVRGQNIAKKSVIKAPFG